jgi:putative DNA modification/repair radical SAM protein
MMTIKEKLEILADAAKYDASCSSSGSYRKRDISGFGNTEGMGICHSYTPDGRCVSLLKILLTNHCIYDCKFCINRVSSDTKRARFTVEEVVWLTVQFYRRNYIEGLFLSSGIVDSVDSTMDRLTEVARKLREEEKFGGYIHLKVVPGASPEMIEKAGLYADRVSANIELPTQGDLDRVATAKKITTATDTMELIRDKRLERTPPKTKTTGTSEASAVQQSKELSPWLAQTKASVKKERIFAPAGQTTQMIVGATAASDATILMRTQGLYKKQNLRRVYYSAYSPIPNADASLPVTRPALIRENRLYQADWLLRFYGFSADELTTKEDPNLSLEHDPKTSWALIHREFFPVDINKAPREALLRVPGIGARNADRILTLRRHRGVKLEDLRKLRVSVSRARYFVVTADHNPDIWKIDRTDLSEILSPKKERQLSLFDDGHQPEGANGEQPADKPLLALPKKDLIVQPDLIRPTINDILAVHSGEL